MTFHLALTCAVTGIPPVERTQSQHATRRSDLVSLLCLPQSPAASDSPVKSSADEVQWVCQEKHRRDAASGCAWWLWERRRQRQRQRRSFRGTCLKKPFVWRTGRPFRYLDYNKPRAVITVTDDSPMLCKVIWWSIFICLYFFLTPFSFHTRISYTFSLAMSFEFLVFVICFLASPRDFSP